MKMASQTLTADLHVACMLNDFPRVKHLLTLGAHRNAENASGTTALQLADFLHRVEIVKLLLHDVDIKGEGGCELLRAIRMDHATVVQALLEMGVREELEGDGGFFKGVLVLACCVSNGRVLDALVRFGPAVGVVGSIKDVLVQCALVAGNLEVVDGIRELVADERGIDMGSTSNNSPAPSAAESVMDPSYYGIAHGWNPAVALDTRNLLVQSISRT